MPAYIMPHDCCHCTQPSPQHSLNENLSVLWTQEVYPISFTFGFVFKCWAGNAPWKSGWNLNKCSSISQLYYTWQSASWESVHNLYVIYAAKLLTNDVYTFEYVQSTLNWILFTIPYLKLLQQSLASQMNLWKKNCNRWSAGCWSCDHEAPCMDTQSPHATVISPRLVFQGAKYCRLIGCHVDTVPHRVQ